MRFFFGKLNFAGWERIQGGERGLKLHCNGDSSGTCWNA